MNIYIFELKAQLKSLIVWTLSILLIQVLFMSGMYSTFVASRDAVEAALQGMPPMFVAAFGLHLDTIFSFGGFYSFVFTYIALFGAIMAASMSIAVFAREKRAKCTDFLLTKPVGRARIFASKTLAVVTLLLITNVLFVAVTILLFSTSEQSSTSIGTVIWASCALFFTQAVFAVIGRFYAVFAKKVRSVSGAATAIGFAGFILSALQSILEKEELRYIAPLKYFDTASVFVDGGFEVKYVLTAVIVIVVLGALALVRYSRRDAPSL